MSKLGKSEDPKAVWVELVKVRLVLGGKKIIALLKLWVLLSANGNIFNASRLSLRYCLGKR